MNDVSSSSDEESNQITDPDFNSAYKMLEDIDRILEKYSDKNIPGSGSLENKTTTNIVGSGSQADKTSTLSKDIPQYNLDDSSDNEDVEDVSREAIESYDIVSPNYDIGSLPQYDQSQRTSTTTAGHINSRSDLTEKERKRLENKQDRETKKRKLEEEKEARKALKLQERQQKKAEAERSKAAKQALQNATRNMKPDQAMKFITAQIDENIPSQDFGRDISTSLQNVEVSCRITSNHFPNTITWIRRNETSSLSGDGLAVSTHIEDTEEVLLIIPCTEFVELVSNKSLTVHVQTIRSLYENRRITLVLFGMEKYFRYHKNQKNNEFRKEAAAVERNTTDSSKFKNVVKVSRREIENALTELQILFGLCYRMLETSLDVSLFVTQMSKSIAQLPYKLEKQEQQLQANWYMSGDNKDTVKVDKDGNGLSRLWRQQLTSFPLARLETAEAICSNYSTMSSLMEAYDNCHDSDTPDRLLQDIPIRRAAGPLTSVRKIGPELSKRIHKYFTSLDGELLL